MSAANPVPAGVTDAIDAYVEALNRTEYPGGSPDERRAASDAFAAIGDAIAALDGDERQRRIAAESERDALRALLLEHAEAHERYEAALADEAAAFDRGDRDLRGVSLAIERTGDRAGRADRALVAWTRAHLAARHGQRDQS